MLRDPKPPGDLLALMPLYGRCFRYNDTEYEYSLCPFNNVTQTNKVGSDVLASSWLDQFVSAVNVTSDCQ